MWMSLRKRILLSIGKRFYVKKVNGLLYLLDMKNRVDRRIDAFSEYEDPQIDLFFSMLKKENCNHFIDIGSHWGWYSLRFSKEACFDQADIYAFEPDEINRNQLYANLFLNKLHSRVIVYDYALSDKKGKINFHHYEENNRGRSCIAEYGNVVVQTAILDDILKLKNQVIGVKIDVEGHELNVLSGMVELLKNNSCILQIESFDDVLPSLLSKLSKNGYKKVASIDYDYYFIKNPEFKS